MTTLVSSRRPGWIFCIGVALALSSCATVPKGSPDDFSYRCEHNDADACGRLGFALAWGPPPNDVNAARRYLKRACAAGQQTYCSYLGNLYEAGGDIGDAARARGLHERACEHSNVLGCVNLGRMFQRGLGVEKDLSRARKLFAAACDASPSAQAGYGCAMLAQLVVEEDRSAALELSTKACRLENALGCTQLGAHELQSEDPNKRAVGHARLVDMCTKNIDEACSTLNDGVRSP